MTNESNPITTDGEIVERINAAFKEMGWGHVQAVINEGLWISDEARAAGVRPIAVSPSGVIPAAVKWQAGHIMGLRLACWSCFDDDSDESLAIACMEGRCGHPEGPSRPPRELLVARP